MSTSPAGAVSIGTPLSPGATRVLLLGSGELGKEVAIELQRLGAEVVAVDRYAVVPEIEAIATQVLAEVEATGVRVVPTARATRLTMDREGIRRLAAEELG